MECIKQRQETGQKTKCENGFSIIGGFVLVVEEEASLYLGIYVVCTEDGNGFPAMRYGDFEAVWCDSTARLCELAASVVALAGPELLHV